MRKFLKKATKDHSQLNDEFESAIKSLMEFGMYLGEKKDEDFAYMNSLLEFASAVNKVKVEIDVEAAKLERERRKKEAEEERKRQKKIRDQQRKEQKERARKQRKSSKPRNRSSRHPGGLASMDENKEMTVEDSLEAKLSSFDAAFGTLSTKNLNSAKKRKSKKRSPKTKEEKKMNDKLNAAGLNSDDMFDLFSLRRASRLPSPSNSGHHDADKKKKDRSRKSWNCPQCTFKNSYLLPECEMCKTKS